MFKLIGWVVLIFALNACHKDDVVCYETIPVLEGSRLSVSEDTEGPSKIGTIVIAQEGGNPYAIRLTGNGSDLFKATRSGDVLLRQGAVLDFQHHPFYHLSASAFNCAGQSSSVDLNITVTEYFNPFKTAEITSGNYVMSVAYSDGYAASGEAPNGENGMVRILKINPDGYYEETARFSADTNDSSFGSAVALNQSYLAAGSHRSADIYLYKRHNDNTFSSLGKIKIDDPFAHTPHGRQIALYDNFLLIGALGKDPKGGKAWLYRIEENETVTLQHTFVPPQTTNDSFFANSVALNSDTIAISQAIGNDIYLFHYDSNGVVHPLNTLIPSFAQPEKFYNFQVKMSQQHLLVGSDKVLVYPLKADGTADEIEVLPFDQTDQSLFGRSVEISQETLLVESAKGVSIYTIQGDTITPLERLEDGSSITFNSSAAMAMQGHTFMRIYSNGQSLFSYETKPKHKIYVYTRPDIPFEVPEGEPPYVLYHVNADSPDAPLAYRLTGEDVSYFQMDGPAFSTQTVFDYEHPLDHNADNDYNQSIILSDALGHDASITASVRILDMDYTFGNKIEADAQTQNLGMALTGENDTVLASADDSAILFTREQSSGLKQIAKVTNPNTQSCCTSFGFAVAINAQQLFVSAPSEDGDQEESGAVYRYQRDQNGLPTQAVKIQPDNLVESADFGRALAVEGRTLAIGAPHQAARNTTGGELYLYTLEDNGSVSFNLRISAQNSSASRDLFGAAFDITAQYIAVGAPGYVAEKGHNVGALYLFQREENGTVTQQKMLNPDTMEPEQFFGNTVVMDDHYLATASESNVYLYRFTQTEELLQRVAFITDENFQGDVTALALHNHELFIGTDNTVKHYSISDDNTVKLIETIMPKSQPSPFFGHALLVTDKDLISTTPYKKGALYLYHEDSN